ncbi:MAG: flagellar motor protein MotB [Pseudomonadota bacterium]
MSEHKRKNRFTEMTQEGDDSGSWALSYGDMMTLLLCFFILIVSVSTINQQKFEEVAASMAKGMSKKKAKPLDETVRKVQEMIVEDKLENQVDTEMSPEGAKISLLGKTLFNTGQAKINEAAYPILDKIIGILKADQFNHYIVVEGHTDNVPINTDQFPSNWELSAARSSTIIRYLSTNGLDPYKCKAVGYADTLPKVPNEDTEGNAIPENQAINRRVIIKLTKNLKE